MSFIDYRCVLNILIALCLVITVCSETFTVDPGDADDFYAENAVCLNNVCPNINAALVAASSYDTIILLPGTYSGKANINLCEEFSSDYDCRGKIGMNLIGDGPPSSVVINGPGLASSSRFLSIIDGTIGSVSNMTLRNFIITPSDQGGGAIHISNDQRYMLVNISNMIFLNNAAPTGGALHVYSPIYNSGGTIVDKGYSNRTQVVVKNSLFQNNSGHVNGGAIASYRSSIAMRDCVFLNNTVNGRETAISSSDVTTSVGGAIYFAGITGNLLRSNSNVYEGNNAQRGGGAIFMQSDEITSAEHSFVIKGDTYEGNYATGQVTCAASLSCNTRGGALYVNALGANIEDCLFVANYVGIQDQTNVAEGGALYTTNFYGTGVSKNTVTSIVGTNFTSNYAYGRGGAVYALDQVLTVNSSRFAENVVLPYNIYFTDQPSQGGAIYVSPSTADSSINGCEFTRNIANSGSGGAIYGIDSDGSGKPLVIRDTLFTGNQALSSYTNAAQGGAIMVSNQFGVNIDDSTFINNSAVPRMKLTPLTYSGTGGALFVRSSYLQVTGSTFKRNIVATGQFDAGATGGAITVEDSYPVIIQTSLFDDNGASGFFGYSPFAMPGIGGALYVKFSSADIETSILKNNWASAGSGESSLGGAIAAFFDISDVQSQGTPVSIRSSQFLNNTALGEVCLPSSPESGAGGAVSFNGVGSGTPVTITDTLFKYNTAVSSNEGVSRELSVGGAIAIAQSSDVYISNGTFEKNLALFGVGNDIASVSGGTSIENNTLNVVNSSFDAGNVRFVIGATHEALAVQDRACATIQGYYDAATSASQSSYRQLNAISTEHVHLAEVDNLLYTHHLLDLLADVKAQPIRSKNLDALEVLINEQLTGLKLREDSKTKKRASSRSHFPQSVGSDAMSLGSDITIERFLKASFDPAKTITINSSLLSVLIDFNPGVVVSSGRSSFDSLTIPADYHMFFGDYHYLSVDQTDGTATTLGDESVSEYGSQSEMVGNIVCDHLVVSIISASLTFLPAVEFQLRQLNLFNGTLIVDREITIQNASFVSESSIQSAVVAGVKTKSMIGASKPQLNFLDDVYVGLTLGRQITHSGFVALDIDVTGLRNYSASVVLLEGCSMAIYSQLIMTSPRIDDANKVEISSATSNIIVLKMTENANLTVAESGSMLLFADTDIIARVPSTFTNEGNIALLGDTVTVVQEYTNTYLSLGFNAANAAQGSLKSTLTVTGNYVQTPTGSLYVTLNHSYGTYPVVFLSSNETFEGHVYVDFYTSPNNGPNLRLYDTTPSEWKLFEFAKMGWVPGTSPVSIVGPQGLAFATSYEEFETEEDTMATAQSYELTNIGCNLISTYYDLSEGGEYDCNICVNKNSSCNLCNDGTCQLGHTCSGNHSGAKFKKTCCSSECNKPYGECKGYSGGTEFHCHCTSKFYTGKSCYQPSELLIVLIVTLSGFLVIVIIAIFFYLRSINQKKQVLDDLRDGLLRNTESGYSGNKEYIQAMQQALILNDVFVKWEEIKLEAVIGEGSFGVVHKATFRGAQVAVKQMRSLFVELTEKDIEEFRREAYVMSRLRHPNIVLVMGISLVDQEPIPLPKTKSKFSTVEDSVRRLSSDGREKEKTAPQKTVCIITEYLEQGSLSDILYGPTRLPAEVWTYELVLTCALQAARGMLYLHSHSPPICHRDLKSANLVVDDHWVVKVTDFGMTRIVPEQVMDEDKMGKAAMSKLPINPPDRESVGGYDDIGRDSMGTDPRAPTSESGSIAVRTMGSSSLSAQSVRDLERTNEMNKNFNPVMTSNLGTTAWAAPELLTSGSQARYSIKVDVYSFGMVLWELWEKKRPFEELTSRFDIMDAVRAGKRPIISDTCPPTFRALIQRCWQTEPARRPMFKYIVRYLKDELARVKRQKMNSQSTVGHTSSVNMSYSPFTLDFLSPHAKQQTEEETGEREDSRDSFLRRSFAAAASTLGFGQRGTSTEHPDPTRGSHGGVDGRGSMSSARGSTSARNREHSTTGDGIDLTATGYSRNSSFQPDANEETTDRSSLSRITGLTTLPNMPESRSALINAAQGQNLSLLSESPATPMYMNQLAQQRSTTGGSINRAANNSWRDRYVMKFSGWNSNNPDAGLPPSMGQQQVAASPQVASTPPVQSGRSPLHAPQSPTPSSTSAVNRTLNQAPTPSNASAVLTQSDESQPRLTGSLSGGAKPVSDAKSASLPVPVPPSTARRRSSKGKDENHEPLIDPEEHSPYTSGSGGADNDDRSYSPPRSTAGSSASSPVAAASLESVRQPRKDDQSGVFALDDDESK